MSIDTPEGKIVREADRRVQITSQDWFLSIINADGVLSPYFRLFTNGLPEPFRAFLPRHSSFPADAAQPSVNKKEKARNHTEMCRLVVI